AQFTTKIIQADGKNATGIQVPADAVAALGKSKRPRVKVTISGYTYHNTVAAYGDVFMLGFSKEHREASGLKAGDEVEVTLELATEPQVIEVPDDLAAALDENGLRELFDAQAPSKRKEHVRQVTSAKAQDTRERRIAKIVAQLSS